MVALIDSGDITELLAARSIRGRRKDYTSVAWRTNEWKGAQFHVALLVDDGSIRWLGRAQGRDRVSDRERRVEISEIQEIERLDLEEILRTVPSQYQQYVRFGILPDGVGDTVIGTILTRHPSLTEAIKYLSRQDSFRVPAGNRGRRLNEQRDGTGLILDISGVGREPLRALGALDPDYPSFVSGTTDRMVSEERLLSHDIERFPGMAQALNAHVDWRIFASNGQRVFVMNANMEPLETTLGVDVIYYNEQRHSFVLVQYKRMVRDSSTSRAAWYRPDGNLRLELDRMAAVDNISAQASDGEFRLFNKACWLKLCEPTARVKNPHDLIKGMYLAREYFEELLGTLQGPKGGVRLGYENVPRHLNNTTFVQLVKDGWIGTRGTATSTVAATVEAVLESRRALVFGTPIQ